MTINKTKQEAAKALTDTGVNFSVTGANDETFEFTIRKLKLGTLIQISELSDKLTEVTESTKQTDVIRVMANDAPIKARIIATAIINSQPIPERPKKKLFDFSKQKFAPEFFNENELTNLFMKILTSEETDMLTDIITSQMGIDSFFHSTVSLKGIDLLKKMDETVSFQPSQSGEE